MDPLAVDDLLFLLGSKEAQILQLQRYVAKLEAAVPVLEAEVVPVESPNGQVADAVSAPVAEE